MGLFSKKENTELFKLLSADESEANTDSTAAAPTDLPQHALTAEEVLESEPHDAPAPTAKAPTESPLEALKRRMAENAAAAKQATDSETASPAAPVDEKPQAPRETLLERCKPYTTDASGKSVLAEEKPAYSLESFQEILQRDSEESMQKLAEKYGLSFEDTPKPEEKQAVAKAVAAVLPKDESAEEEKAVPIAEVSDLDPIQPIPDEPSDISHTATIRFTPIHSDDANQEKIQVSSQTRSLDLTREISSVSVPKENADTPILSQSEFDAFTTADDPKDPAEAKKALHRYSVKRRNSFLRLLFSVLLFLILSAFYLPFLSGLLLHAPKIGAVICTAVLTVELLIHADMFGTVKLLFSRRASTDTNVLLAVLSIIGCGIAGFLIGESVHTLCAIGSFLLLLRALTQFMQLNSICGNLRQLVKAQPLKAIALIDDSSATLSMAGDSIEGDVLIAAPQKTEFAFDLMKYSRFSKVLMGKLKAITLISLGLALLSGISYALISHQVFDGCYLCTAVLCLATAPPLFLTEALPNSRAAARMNKKGSYLGGIAGAERLEQANGLVLSTKDIFPPHAVTLHDMKVLNDHDCDRVLIRAAALAEAMDSPLAPIFKRISDSDVSYEIPNTDSIKYEKGLGISGWVDEGILFIGNRKIMEAHGIAVPPIETEYRILQSGFFPVYIAYGGKACALLSVQYAVDPEVSALLHRAARMGLTMLFRNCDANLTDEMLCDYFGLYEDSVHIMSPAGVNMCRMKTAKVKHCSSPAGFRGDGINFVSLMLTATRVKQANRLLSVFYIIAACFGIMMLLYLSFSGIGDLPGADTLFWYEAASLLFSYALFLFKRP